MADFVISATINADGTVKGAATAKREIKSISDTAKSTGKGLRSAFDIDFAAIGKKINAAGQQIKQIGSSLQSAGQQMTLAITAPLVALGTLGVKAALEADKARTKISALLGSQEAANKKIAELRDLANKSVGVTQAAAIETYSQLKGIGGIAEESINRMIKAMGKLNAAFNIDDQAGFMRNLTQIFSQGFERADIKEAIGRVPFFEQLLEQAFGTKDAAKLNELKKAGKLTLDSFMDGLSNAIQTDPRIANIGENLTTKLTKAFERLNVALAPFGQIILDAIVPIFEKLSPMIENLGKYFSTLSPAVQQAAVVFAALIAALGPALFILGSIVSAVGSVVAAIGTLVGSASVVGIALAAVVGLLVQIGPVLAIVGAEIYVLYQAWQTNFGGIRDLTMIVAEAVQNAWTAAVTAIRDLTGELTAEITKFWQENGDDIMKAVQTVSDFIRSIWTAIVEFWRENGDTIKQIATVVWNAVKEIIKGVLEVILGVIKTATAIMNGDWQKAWDGIKMIVEGAGRQIVAILQGAGQLWLGAVRAALNAIFSLNKWVYDQAIGLAKSIVDGMVQGLKLGVAPIAAAARLLVKTPLDVIRSGFGIKSPSKVTEEIGGYITEGLAIGMGNGSDQVRQVAGDLINNTLGILFDGTMSWSDKLKNVFGNIAQTFKQMVGNMAQSWLHGLFGQGSSSGSGGGLFGGNQGGGIFNASASGGGRAPNGALVNLPNGQQAVQVNGSGGGFGSIFGKGGIFGEQGFGNNVGTYGAVGGGLGALGGLIGGRAGGFLSNIGSGIGIGAQIGSIIPGLGTAVGAIVGGAVGFLSSLFGGDPKRKRDKKEHLPALNSGFVDAMRQLRELIGDVRTLRVDPDSALAKATELRGQIASGFGIQFESKKYQKQSRQLIATKLTEADGLIAELRAAADVARAAGARRQRIIPEFAGGVFMSAAFQRFREVNGMLPGMFTGHDRIPAMLADGEMVLNPRQQRNIRLNAGGRDVFSNAGIPGYAGGGVAGSQQTSSTPATIVLQFEHSIDANGMVNTALKSPMNQNGIKVIVEDKYANDELKLKRRGA